MVADHISDYLFVLTENSWKDFIEKGVPEKKIHVTGNTIEPGDAKKKSECAYGSGPEANSPGFLVSNGIPIAPTYNEDDRGLSLDLD